MSDNSPDISALEHCVESIGAAYERLGHRLGWRFLSGPQRTFTSRAPFALITLNPGGARENPDHPRASSENGSAYWIESWKGHPPGTAPLQLQFQELFARIVAIVDVRESPRAFVENRVLAAHFVPFRSPSLDALHRRSESIAFARQFWAELLAEWIPQTILTIDRVTFKNLRGIISDGPAEVVDYERFPTGWERCTAEAFRFRTSERGETVTLARLPHRSRTSSTTYVHPVTKPRRRTAPALAVKAHVCEAHCGLHVRRTRTRPVESIRFHTVGLARRRNSPVSRARTCTRNGRRTSRISGHTLLFASWWASRPRCRTWS